MIQVMLNCSTDTSDWYNLDSVVPVLISHLESAATILRLLSTAIARGHNKVVEAGFRLPVVQQSTAAAITQLMLGDVAVDEGVGAIVKSSRGNMMHLLVQLPAATYVARRDVMLLLEKSVATGNGAAVKALCTLLATKTTTARSIVKLLSMAIQLSLDEAVAALCRLPAAKNISNHEWSFLATTAIQGKLRCGSAVLCKLPAAAHAAHEPIAELLSSAVHFKLYTAAEALVSLPAAGCMPSEQVFELTQELVFHSVCSPLDEFQRSIAEEHYVDTLKGFGKLKAVQDMSSTELLNLFIIAVEGGRYHPAIGGWGPTVDWLAKLAAASSIPAEVMHQQMRKAVQQQNVRLVSALCDLPAAKHVDADALLHLLNMARQEDSSTSRIIQQLLCSLTVHMQLSHRQLMAFLLPAVSAGQYLSDFSGKRGWTKHMTTSNIADLLAAAIQSNSSCHNVSRLCSLAAAASISSTVVAELLSAVLDRCGSRASTLRSLCSLPGARQISKDVAAALICKAEQWGDLHSVQALQPLQTRHSQRLQRRGR